MPAAGPCHRPIPRMSSSAPAAMPSATRETDRATNAGAGTARREVDARLAGHRVAGPRGRHLDALGPDVLAAGAAEPADLPGVLDHDLLPGDDREPHAGRATRLVVVQAVEPHPGRVLHAGDEAPPPGHPEPFRPGGLGRPARGDRARDDRAGLGEQLVEGGAGQVDHVDPGTRPDHHRPPDGGIGTSQGLDRVQLVGQRPLDTSVAAGQEHPEAAGARQQRHEIRWQPTCGLGLRGPGGHLRGQDVDRGQDRLGRVGDALSHGLAHGFSSGLVARGQGWVGGGSGWRCGRRRIGRLGGMPRSERLVPVPAAEDGHLGDLSVAHRADVQPAGGEQPTVRHGLGHEMLGEEAVLGGRGPYDVDRRDRARRSPRARR